MPRTRTSMRKIREVLRLKYACGLTNRQIAKTRAMGRTAVADYLRRAHNAGLGWPLPEGLDDAELEQRLFPPVGISAAPRPRPDCAYLHRELRRKGVTLFLLWEEYRAVHPEGYQYSRFCDLYRAWAGKLKLSMRQTHKAGEKLFFDYAGHTLPIVDPRTGEDLGIPLVGIVDLILSDGDRATIADFKTAARSSAPLEISHEIQLTSYAWLFRQVSDRPESQLQIRSLIKTKVPQIKFHCYPARTQNDLRRLFAVIREYLDALDRSRFNYRPGWGCSMCDYRETHCRRWCG